MNTDYADSADVGEKKNQINPYSEKECADFADE